MGNYVTSRTTSAIRYFSCLITVNLPVTNILASSELGAHGYQGYHESQYGYHEIQNEAEGAKGQAGDGSTIQGGATFSDYVHYAAPATNFTTIRSIFPPAAITLGRNFLDRFGDLISDFEIISVNGDRIPVSLMVLVERWGYYFIELLANGYVHAVQRFDQAQKEGGAGKASFMSMGSSLSSGPAGTSASGASSGTSTGSGSGINLAGLTTAATASSGTISPDTSASSANITTASSSNSGNSGNSGASSGSSGANSGTSGANSGASGGSGANTTGPGSYHLSLPVRKKDAPHFRLPFQDSAQVSALDPSQAQSIDKSLSLPEKTIDPHALAGLALALASLQAPGPFLAPAGPGASANARKDSVSSFSSANSLLNSHLQDIPAQLPLPSEPIPAVPSNPSFRSSSRRSSNDMASPRGSLLHTLTALRNIPLGRSPRGSPFASPRASVSGPTGPGTGPGPTTSGPGPTGTGTSPGPSARSHSPVGMGILTPDLSSSPIPSLRPVGTSTAEGGARTGQDGGTIPDGAATGTADSTSTTFGGARTVQARTDGSTDGATFDPLNNILLDFNTLQNGTFQMESSLIPRRLYIPFATTSVKAFCEYLYTGQIGNKWLLTPTTLDNLALAKHYKVPLLYDLISEVLYGIIGKREAWVIQRANELKENYFALLRETSSSHDGDFEFPLDEYEGFMDTVDDGYLDIALLKKTRRERRSEGWPEGFFPSTTGAPPEATGATASSSGPGSNEPEPEPEAESSDSDSKESDSGLESESSGIESESSGLGLGYLDAQNDLPNMGPRSKSIFDRAEMGADRTSMDEIELDDKRRQEHHRREQDLALTLEQLVSPTSPVPSLHIIDLIYESVIFVADLKLMLRTSNARQMSRLLERFEEDMAVKMDEVRAKYDERQQLFRAREARTASSSSVHLDSVPPSVPGSTLSSSQRVPLLKRGSSTDGDSFRLRPVGSTSSLTTMGSRHTRPETDEGPDEGRGPSRPEQARTGSSTGPSGASTSTSGPVPLERARTNSSIRTGISGLTPFKPVKADPKLLRSETNKEVDKRITKLIKKDEKLKQKMQKEEKLRLQQHIKQSRKTGSQTEVPSTSAGASGPSPGPSLGPSASSGAGLNSSASPAPVGAISSASPGPSGSGPSGSGPSGPGGGDDSSIDSASISSKKKHHHGLLHHIGLGKHKEKDHDESRPGDSASPTASLHSKHSGEKKKHGLFGLKK